jgi:hypothetical protein
MVEQAISEFLKSRLDEGIGPKELALEIINDESKVGDLISGLNSENHKIKASCAEAVSIISEENPEKLCGYMNVFTENLLEKKPELHKFYTNTIANLASINETARIPELIKVLAQNLTSDNETLQTNSVIALCKIARVKTNESEKIFNLLIAHTKYFPGNRINVILENMLYFSDNAELREDARRFLEHYAFGKSKKLQRKAEDVLKKFF